MPTKRKKEPTAKVILTMPTVLADHLDEVLKVKPSFKTRAALSLFLVNEILDKDYQQFKPTLKEKINVS
jgi:hypothetical protein